MSIARSILFSVIWMLTCVGVCCLMACSQSSSADHLQQPAGPPAPTGASDITESLARLESGAKFSRIQGALELSHHPLALEEFIDPLSQMLIDRDDEVRQAGQQAFSMLGAHAVDALKSYLWSQDNRVFAIGCEAVNAVGPAAAKWQSVLAANLGSDDLARRMAAAHAFAGLGAEGKQHVELIARLLDEQNFNAQIFACRALIAMGPEAKAAAPKLIHVFRNGNLSARTYAGWALGAIGPVEGFDTVAEIGAKLDAVMQPEKERALRGLSYLGEAAMPLAPRIRELMRDKHANVEPWAAFALWKVTGETKEPVAVLVELGDSPVHGYTALQRLAEMGPAAAPAIDHIKQSLADPDESIRELAALILGNIGPAAEGSIPELKALEEDPSLLVRWEARRAIEKIQK